MFYFFLIINCNNYSENGMMIRNKLLLYLFGISACFVAGTVGRLSGEGIVGGEIADDNQFPYQVSLQWYSSNFCGGGIIGDQFVLTAAHCVIEEDGRFSPKRINVVAGTNDLNYVRKAVIVEVAKIYVPLYYSPELGDNLHDIAVLKLKEPLGLSTHKNLQKLELPKDPLETYAGETVKISGFGWDWVKVFGKEEEIGGTSDTSLRFAEAEVLSTEECQAGYTAKGQLDDYTSKISDKQICARTKQRYIFKPSGVCSGDSGGPLVHDGKTVVGVVSTSPIGCTEKKSAAIYTRVSSYLDFIDDAMNDRKRMGIRTFELIRSSNSYKRPTSSYYPTYKSPLFSEPSSADQAPLYNKLSYGKPSYSKSPSIFDSWFGGTWG